MHLTRLLPLGLALALFGFLFIGSPKQGTRASAASLAPSPIASTLTVSLFYDGAFENISFNEPKIDSQGRLIVAGSTFGGGASFPFRLYSISPNGILNWQYPSGDEFLFTNYSFLPSARRTEFTLSQVWQDFLRWTQPETLFRAGR